MIGRLGLLAIPSTLAVVIYMSVVFSLSRHETGLLFQADRTPPDVANANVDGLQSVRVRTADGLDLTAWFLPPPPGQMTILYLHGNGGNLTNRIGRVRRMARQGNGLLFLEYRGYGGNPGTPSEDGLAADAAGALSFLRDNGIEGGHVVLYGESLGTGVAVRLATDHRVGGVILDAPYTSIANVAQSRFPLLPIKLLIRNRFDLIGRIARIGAPLLIVQGARDHVIPPAMGRAVYEAAVQPKTIWVAPDGTHDDVLESGGEPIVTSFIAGIRMASRLPGPSPAPEAGTR